jgi:hypothetical protein
VFHVNVVKQDHDSGPGGSSMEDVAMRSDITDSESDLSDVESDLEGVPVLVDHHETTTLRDFVDRLPDPTACMNGLNLPGRREGPVDVVSSESVLFTSLKRDCLILIETAGSETTSLRGSWLGRTSSPRPFGT